MLLISMLYYYLFRLLLNDSQNSISKADVLFLLTSYPKKVAQNNKYLSHTVSMDQESESGLAG